MNATEMDPDEALGALHASLAERRRPEDVAYLVFRAVRDRVGLRERRTLNRVARTAFRWNGMTSMGGTFARPVGGERQVAAAARLFELDDYGEVDTGDPASLVEFTDRIGVLIGASSTRVDFRADRLNRADRAAAGLDISKRQYNRRFRALRRVAAKAGVLEWELAKRRLTLVARAGFAESIDLERFHADPIAGCFVAYYTARRKVRREFTLSGRDNPYDEVADLLFQRAKANPATDWWMIAQAYPVPEVLTRLTETRRGELLGRWWSVMREVADSLSRLWEAGEFDRATMVVRRGDDSSTWNALAGTFNTVRAGWLSCLAACDALDALDACCPGKAMMLIAGDLAAWHSASGGGLHPDVTVWARLPLPWDTLSGAERCTRTDVVAACADAGVDPGKTGWVTPRPPGPVGAFRPTPELVHGVSVIDPIWAGLLRSEGWFRGKPTAAGRDTVAQVPPGIVTSDLPERPDPESDGHADQW